MTAQTGASKPLVFRWRTLAVLGLFALSACNHLPPWRPHLWAGGAEPLACRQASPVNPAAAASLPGTGGTGQMAGIPGTGGTGHPAAPGTGGTGIVGVVTGFASICVNGVEVNYTPDVPVERDGAPSSLRDLAVGQWVALQADGRGADLRAQRIVVLEAVEGPLTAIEPASGQFAVMGDEAFALRASELTGLKAGDWVRVSGQRRPDGQIRASRVQSVAPGTAKVTGPYADERPGVWRVGGVKVVMAEGVKAPLVLPGQEVGLSGRWVQGQLVASAVVVQPTRAAIGSVRDVLLQGYVQSVQGNALQLGYERVTLGDGVQLNGHPGQALQPGQVVRARGQMDAAQQVTIDHIEIWREAIRGDAGRRSRAQTGSDDGGSEGSRESGDEGSKSSSDSRKASSRRGDRASGDRD